MMTYKHKVNTDNGKAVSFYVPIRVTYYGQARIAVLAEPVFAMIFAPDEYGDIPDYKLTAGGVVTITHCVASFQRAMYMLAGYVYTSFADLERVHTEWVVENK